MEESALRLRGLLDETGMTQQELADKSGVHKSKISKYLKGEYCPKADAAQKMAKVLNVSPVWLMGIPGVDRKNNPNASLNSTNSLEIEEALKLYKQYKNAIPQIQSAVDSLLKSDESQP